MAPYTHWFIRARLKTRQLLLLVALAEEGNIHRAAQVLNMTQPAASKLLKDLEDMLEVELFERLPRGMRPTWYGESMIRHARMVLANLGQAYDEITALKAGLFGQVGVGAITTPGITLLPRAMSQIKQEHPNLRVSLDIETSPVLMERLAQGKLDWKSWADAGRAALQDLTGEMIKLALLNPLKNLLFGSNRLLKNPSILVL